MKREKKLNKFEQRDLCCPKAANHTPTPEGYIDFHSWAERMTEKGYKQYKCVGCYLYKIWHKS